MLSVNGPLHVCTHLNYNNNLHFSDVQYTVNGNEELTSEQHTDRTSKYFIFLFFRYICFTPSYSIRLSLGLLQFLL